MREIFNAEDIDKGQVAIKAFAIDFGAKFPQSGGRDRRRRRRPVGVLPLPAERWIHLRTTNPIESTFATVRLRTKVTKGPGHARPELPWPTSSSTPHKPAGARSQMHPTKARVIQREQSADTGTGHGVPDCGQHQGNDEKPARTLRGTEPCSAAPKVPTYMRTSVNV